VSSRYQAQIDTDLPNNTHAELVRQVGFDQRVLELGAATGYMTTVLVERGCTVTALERDPAAAAELRRIAEHTVVADLDAEDAFDEVDGPFDVVLAGDVLEHLVDPTAVLRRAAGLLAPTGRAVISVPNVTHGDLRLALFHGRFDYQSTGLLDETHLRFFTYESLLAMVGDAGLLPETVARTVTDLFGTEVALPREDVGTDIAELIATLPESLTYQFVLSAVVDDGDPERKARVATRFTENDDVDRLRGFRPTELGASMPEQIALLQKYLLGAEAERDRARDLVSDRTAERDAAQLDAQAATAAAAELRELVGSTSADNERLKAQADDLNRTKQVVAADLLISRSETAAAVGRADQLADQLVGAELEIAALLAEVNAARGELRAACVAESDNGQLRAQVAELTRELMDSRAAAGNRMDPRGVDVIVADLVERSTLAQAATAHLEEVEGSRAYLALTRYRRWVDRLAPTDSRRRRALRRWTPVG